MGSGEVGGDGSAQWDMHGNNIISHNSSSGGPGRRKHEAKDRTDPGDPFFYVTIKLPQDGGQRSDFLNSLQQGLSDGQMGNNVTFRLRIEDKGNYGPTKDQIRIAWTSLGDSGPGQAPVIAKPRARRRSASLGASKKASKKTSSRQKRKGGRRR
jgi:hypothetical protein